MTLTPGSRSIFSNTCCDLTLEFGTPSPRFHLVQVLSRLPPHRNIVRFFAEYRERIPPAMVDLLPDVARVGPCLVCLVCQARRGPESDVDAR